MVCGPHLRGRRAVQWLSIISGKSVLGAVRDAVRSAFLLDTLLSGSAGGADPAARSRAAVPAGLLVPDSKHHREKEAAETATGTGP